MKTIEKLSFPKLENEYLENMLRQLVHQYNIIQMFFTGQEHSAFSFLIIHMEKNTDAQNLVQTKWVRKVKELFQINISFICSSKLEHYYSLGNPFIAYYCHESALIYENNELKHSIFRVEEWKKYKENFYKYENNFYHDHDLHLWQVKNLISEGVSNSIFTSYGRLFEYDLEYLEDLYLGGKSSMLSLDERINNLTTYIPKIQKYFVRNSPNKFYLTNLFIKAKEASADDDLIYNEEMYGAVGIAQQGLYDLVEERLQELKKGIKKRPHKTYEAVCIVEDKPKNILLDTAIETIIETVEVEEIYLYHQITYGEKTTYYLLLIANGAGNEKLKSITRSLDSKTEGKHAFVLISHTRYWIQSNLYQNQDFFSKVIKSDYLIYLSSKYLSELHWEIPHKPFHNDLYFYYKPTQNTALQFFAIANNVQENYQGLEYFFALFFISFCRTYIFIKTYYIPNYLSSKGLWQLCIYADSDIQKYNYLIEQFYTNFFPYLDRNMSLHHKLSKLNKDEVSQMNIIIEKLMHELQNLVIKGRLLSNFEQD